MKRFFVFTLVILVMAGNRVVTAQHKQPAAGKAGKFKLRGTVDSDTLNQGFACILYAYKGEVIRDTVALKNNKYVIKGKIDEPATHTQVYCFLTTNRQDPGSAPMFWSDVFLAPGVNKLLHEKDQLNRLAAPSKTGLSQVQLDYVEAINQLKEGKGDTEVFMQYIKTHPSSVLSVEFIQHLMGRIGAQELETMLGNLSEPIRQLPSAQRLINEMASARTFAVGQPAADLTLNDVNGKPVSLSSFRGKYVLLDFWASWCGPCRAENPNVLSAYEKFHHKGFDVFAVSLDEEKNKDKWLEAIKKDGMPWTQVSDLKGWQSYAAVKYGVNAIPATFLIDPDGVIIARDIRGEALLERLKELLP